MVEPRSRGACGEGAVTIRRVRTRLLGSLTLLWAAVIFVASSLPKGGPVPLPGAGIDKPVHGLVYGVLGALLCLTARSRGSVPRRAALWGALLGLAYGVSDELHQTFTPGRTASAADVLADVIGATLGALLALLAPARWVPPNPPAEDGT